jgi:SH3 domain protein
MKIYKFYLIFFLGLFSLPNTAWATNGYVTDSLKITLRTGPSIENKIISVLSSGEAVEVLGEEGDWYHVRLLDRGDRNKEGWLLRRYVMERLPWEKTAKTLERENRELSAKLSKLKEEWKEAVDREKTLAQDLGTNINTLKKLREEYKTLKLGSAEYVKLKGKYEKDLLSLEAAKKEIRRLNIEKERLGKSDRHMWFALGASVLFVGLIIGWAVGRKRRKRSSLY